MAGLDVPALEADLLDAFSAVSGSPTAMAGLKGAIEQIATTEYGGPNREFPGYSESWAQAAACGVLYHGFDLYTLYPPK
jgi:chloramphenicol 3-O-phosphotransferase